jgi:hypothetical protein
MYECEQNEPNSDFVLKTPYFESQSYLKQNLKTVMYRKFYNNRQSYVEVQCPTFVSRILRQ